MEVKRRLVNVALPVSARALILLVAIGFSFFLLFLRGMATPAYAEEAALPSFGNGKTQVRLYTDYFCGPCARLEPKIEPVLSDLVKRNVITLTFVDTPVHKPTPLYASYFHYALNYDRTFGEALRSRAILFDAAKNGIEGIQQLEEYLKANRVKFVPANPRPVFAVLSAFIQEDAIKSTPTCVIISNGKRGIYSGEKDIITALNLVR